MNCFGRFEISNKTGEPGGVGPRIPGSYRDCPGADATRFTVVLLIVALLTASTPTWSAETTASEAKALQERYKAVTEMTELERDRLQRNVAAFEKMSGADREKYRELHRQIQDDKYLATLLQTYSAWLQTLTPGQREELRKATDSAQKLALVRRFKEDQYHALEPLLTLAPDERPPGPPPKGPAKPLSANDLNALMKVLIAELPEDQREKFAHAKLSTEYLKILHQVISHATEGPRAWPPGELQDKLISGLKDDRLRNFIKSHKPHERDDLLGLIVSSIWTRALEEFKPKWPNESELKDQQSKLNTEEKARLEHMKLERRKFELARHYFEERNDGTFRELRDIRNDLDRLMVQLNMSRPKDDGFPPGRRGDQGGPGGPPPFGRNGPPGGPREERREPPPPSRKPE